MDAKVMREGVQIAPGTMLHMTSGPSIGQIWRLEKVAHRENGDHHLHMSRSVPKIGRVHKEFHPKAFGVQIVMDVKIYADRARVAAALRGLTTQAVLLTSGGVIAWAVGEYLNHRYGG